VNNYIRNIGEKVLGGEKITFSEAKKLLETEKKAIVDIMAVANQVRHRFMGNRVDFCTIINAKSGRCSEDCKFCVQSAHYKGECKTYPMLEVEEIVRAAKEADEKGVQRFSIVSSGRSLGTRDFEKVVKATKKIRRETRLEVDCSLGILSEDQVSGLRQAGVERYHHNLETSPSFFEKICTTHSLSEKLKTIQMVKENGLSICSGGIIGLGETSEQWVEMIFLLREIEVDCIPVNILDPRPGTPLENMVPPSPLEIIKLISIMRLIVPDTEIRLAGGREINLRDFQATAFLAGATGMIVGGYLTTGGRIIDDDLQMINDLGLRFGKQEDQM